MFNPIEWNDVYWLFGIWFVLRTIGDCIYAAFDNFLFDLTNPDSNH